MKHKVTDMLKWSPYPCMSASMSKTLGTCMDTYGTRHLHKKLSRAHVGDTLVSLEARIGTWHGVTYQHKTLFQGGENYHLFLVVCFSMEHLLIMQKQCWSSLLLLSWYWFPQIWAFSDTLSVLLTTKNKIFIFHLNFFGSPMCLYHNIFRITLYVSIFVSVIVPMSVIFNSNRFG